jgi:hypothetical protein
VHDRDYKLEPLSDDAKRYVSNLRRLRRKQTVISLLQSQGDCSRSSRKYEKEKSLAKALRIRKYYTVFLIHADISKVLIRAYRKHLDSDEACREIASSPKTSGASDCVTTRLFGRKDLECDRFGIVTYPSFVVERCKRRERS